MGNNGIEIAIQKYYFANQLSSSNVHAIIIHKKLGYFILMLIYHWNYYISNSSQKWDSSVGECSLLKEEIHTRISLILNEREKYFPTEQCKNDQNRIKNKEVMTFWNFTIFRKTLLDQSLWIFKWASWWCHSLTILYSFHNTEMTKI